MRDKSDNALNEPRPITGEILWMSRRGAYRIRVKDGRYNVDVWLKPGWVTGLCDRISENILVTNEGKQRIDLAVQQARENREMDRRLA